MLLHFLLTDDTSFSFQGYQVSYKGHEREVYTGGLFMLIMKSLDTERQSLKPSLSFAA